jgi:nucleoside-diphosphate-sugar epimerase
MSALSGQHCLVTGGAGYVAASLVRELCSVAASVRRFGRSEARPPAPAGVARVEDMIGDVRKREDVERALDGMDVVFHLASQTSVYVADDDPPADLEANVLPMQHLLEACRVSGVKRSIVFASTVTITGLAERLPVTEETPDVPVTTYDVHKRMAEQYLEFYTRRGLVRGGTLRLANVYGPGPKSSRADRGVLNGMVRRALSGENLKVYGTGEFTRDYVYVEDVARAFVKAAEHADKLEGKAYVLSSGHGCTLRHAIGRVAALVEEHTGKAVNVEHVEPPATLSPIESRNFVGNIARLHKATGWSPSVGLDEGIRRTIATFASEQENA